MIEMFQACLRYEANCCVRALQMIESVPEANRQLPQYQTALDKLAHTLSARGMWLGRLGFPIDSPDKLFPTGLSASRLRELMPGIYESWTRWLDGRSADELPQDVEYQSMEGQRFVNRLDEILIQLHGHALYHRGQIATLVDQCGGHVVDTDFIYATRRQVSGG